MYMQSQQQGSFHHPQLHPTATAATAGIIRPVPQHAQPQANRVCVLVFMICLELLVPYPNVHDDLDHNNNNLFV